MHRHSRAWARRKKQGWMEDCEPHLKKGLKWTFNRSMIEVFLPPLRIPPPMLEILASSRPAAGSKMCDRLSRRAMLRIGALAPLGLSLPTLLSAEKQAR